MELLTIHAPFNGGSLKLPAMPAFWPNPPGGCPRASSSTLCRQIVLNCEEQLPILHAVATQLADKHYRFINVSRALPPELIQRSPAAEWVEDQEDTLRELFDVSGYPTMFVVRTDGKIAQVIPGVPERLEADLLARLSEPQGNGTPTPGGKTGRND